VSICNLFEGGKTKAADIIGPEFLHLLTRKSSSNTGHKMQETRRVRIGRSLHGYRTRLVCEELVQRRSQVLRRVEPGACGALAGLVSYCKARSVAEAVSLACLHILGQFMKGQEESGISAPRAEELASRSLVCHGLAAEAYVQSARAEAETAKQASSGYMPMSARDADRHTATAVPPRPRTRSSVSFPIGQATEELTGCGQHAADVREITPERL